MNPDLQQRITEAMRNPQNMGELANADAVKVLRDDHSPYRIIYHAPVDLAKKPGT